MEQKTSWVNLVNLELDTIEEDQILDPKSEVQEGEEPLGTVGLQSRKLYTLWQNTIRETKSSKINLEFENHSEAEEALIYKDLAHLQEKAKVLKTLFWYTVHEQTESWGDSIGIRAEFLVVKARPSNPLTDFLGDMFNRD